MSSQDSSNQSRDGRRVTDGSLESELAPLRSLEPPDALRLAVKARVDEALRQPTVGDAQRIAPTPWWKRRIAVPVPVALATAAALAILLALLALPPTLSPDSATPSFPVRKEASPKTMVSPKAMVALAEPAYSESSLFVRGIGQVHSRQEYGL